MPIREYRCGQCQAEFEELVSGDMAPACPSCGSTKVEPLLSCCRVLSGGDGLSASPSPSSGGGCSGCGGGNCGSCR